MLETYLGTFGRLKVKKKNNEMLGGRNLLMLNHKRERGKNKMADGTGIGDAPHAWELRAPGGRVQRRDVRPSVSSSRLRPQSCVDARIYGLCRSI